MEIEKNLRYAYSLEGTDLTLQRIITAHRSNHHTGCLLMNVCFPAFVINQSFMSVYVVNFANFVADTWVCNCKSFDIQIALIHRVGS